MHPGNKSMPRISANTDIRQKVLPILDRRDGCKT